MTEKQMNIKSESGRITKQGRETLLERAKQLLTERGFDPHKPAAGWIVDDLMREFNIQRRTARIIEAQAARLLRGEYVAAWQRKNNMTEEARRKRSMSLTDGEYERLQSIGDGNATEGVRQLITLHAALSPKKDED